MTIRKLIIGWIGLLLVGTTNFASAGLMFSGVIDLDYTSSIAGAPKGTRYFFSLTLDGTAKDTIHNFSTNGWGGLTFDGFYNPSGGAPITDFQMALDPASNGTFDPSGLTYDLAKTQIFTVDANAAVGQTEPFNEHLTLYIPVLTADSPIFSVYLNLYNSSSLFDPVSFGSRQLILDTSTPTNGFTLDELFLDGLESLGSFQSTRDRVDGPPQAFVDPVFFQGGGNGSTFGAGTIREFSAVPTPNALALFSIGLAGLGWSRRRKV